MSWPPVGRHEAGDGLIKVATSNRVHSRQRQQQSAVMHHAKASSLLTKQMLT